MITEKMPVTESTTPDLAAIAAEINAEHDAGEDATRRGLEHFRRAGEKLILAKQQCGHGQWLPWLKKNVRFSQPTAWAYMRVAKEWEKLSAANNLREALRLLTDDADEDDDDCAAVTSQLPPFEPAPGNCTEADLQALSDGGLKFGTIYADPPWKYGNQGTRACTDGHYETMFIDDIIGMGEKCVRPLAAPQCHLHLWTTNGFFKEAFEVMEAWGFTYKSMFVWCKEQMGIGNYWRVSHELMLLGVKGKRTFRRKNLWSWATLPRGKHSSKPPKARLKIEKASPGPRLELFAREAAPGWVAWGNEIPRETFYRAAKNIGRTATVPEPILYAEPCLEAV
jgi:N6-adenosine-specific RNA methylase IME4